MATPAQIKFIHVLIHKLALPDEHYRDMLSAFGARSSTDPALTIGNANELIDAMIRIAHERGIEISGAGSATFRKSDAFSYLATLGSRKGYATYKQLCKIVLLWWDVSKMQTDVGKWEALRTFVKNKWSIERIEWLPIELVGKIIKTLEAMSSAKNNEPQEAVKW